MKIPDGSYLKKGFDDELVYIISSEKINECIKFINDNNIKHLEIADAYYQVEDLNFLKECVDVENLTIHNHYIKSAHGIYSLRNLKYLSHGEYNNAEIDFNNLNSIERLYLFWNKKINGIESLENLKKLFMWKYKPKNGNFDNLSNLKKLEYFFLTQSNLKTLDGIGNLKNLSYLELNYHRSLTDLGNIGELKDSLKQLEITSCKKIENYYKLCELMSLESCIVSNCGDIPSIGFASHLKNLKHFTFLGTNVIDGDMNPCFGIDYVYFNDKKHYSHKRKTFKNS